MRKEAMCVVERNCEQRCHILYLHHSGVAILFRLRGESHEQHRLHRRSNCDCLGYPVVPRASIGSKIVFIHHDPALYSFAVHIVLSNQRVQVTTMGRMHSLKAKLYLENDLILGIGSHPVGTPSAWILIPSCHAMRHDNYS